MYFHVKGFPIIVKKRTFFQTPIHIFKSSKFKISFLLYQYKYNLFIYNIDIDI